MPQGWRDLSPELRVLRLLLQPRNRQVRVPDGAELLQEDEALHLVLAELHIRS